MLCVLCAVLLWDACVNKQGCVYRGICGAGCSFRSYPARPGQGVKEKSTYRHSPWPWGFAVLLAVLHQHLCF